MDSTCNTADLVVNPVNDAPRAVDNDFSGNEDNDIGGNVLANDSDVDNASLTATLVAGPAHGTLVLNADGSFTYTPDANWHGGDSFTYVANDGALDSNVATVNLTVNPVDDVPVAVDDSFTTNEDTPLSGSLAGNDTPSGDGGNVWSLTTGPSHGTVVVNPDGTFSYRFALPDGNYELPITAASVHTPDRRVARLQFSRAPEYRGQVTAHPQDVSLRTASPENVQ